MKKRILMIAVILLSLFTIFLSGCSEDRKETITVFEPELTTKVLGQESVVTFDTSEGEIEIIFISSEKWGGEKVQTDVKEKFFKIMESGKYEIIAVKTVYVNGYLAAAEIYYRK